MLARSLMINPSKQRSVSRLTSWIDNQRGAAALIVLVIVLGVSVLVVSTTALIGVGNLSIGFSTQSSSSDVLLAESCVEETLVRLTRDNTYSGGTLAVENTTCTITVTGTPCGACTVDVSATENDFTRRVRAGVTIAGSDADITSWQEVE